MIQVEKKQGGAIHNTFKVVLTLLFIVGTGGLGLIGWMLWCLMTTKIHIGKKKQGGK